MKDFNLLCMGCMKIKPTHGICPYCNFDLEKYQDEKEKKGLHYLQPGSILNGRYMVGKVLGEGGFGITYIGWNLNLEKSIAIKEYFPNGFVTRNANETDTVSVLSGEGKEKFYLKQKERFLDEAKTLGRLDDIDSIVSVKDCFAENGTAYIIMEYLEGEDFGSYLKRNGGKLPANQVFDMMEPIIEALALIHKDNNGLIHRDISPDNIRITKNLKVKLMDFGAARETDDEKSLSVVLKPGYAPEEQYRTRGKQGPWTDVYGLCATMYRAIVGKKPIESLERIMEDYLKAPSELGILMDEKQEQALMKGLAVSAKNRWQSMDELHEALYLDKKRISNDRQQYVREIFDREISDFDREMSNNGYRFSQQFMQEREELKRQVRELKRLNKQLEEQLEEQQGQSRKQKVIQGQGNLQRQANSQKKENLQEENLQEQAMIVLKNKMQIDRNRKTIVINPGYESVWTRENDKKKSRIVGAYSKIPEYELTLSVAVNLKNELQKRGYNAILTRNNGEEIISAADRIKMSLEYDPNMIITLHARTSDVKTMNGAKVFIARENGILSREIYEKNKNLANLILEEYCAQTRFQNQGSMEWNLIETECSQKPSIVLDIGYMSNKDNDLYMAEARNQKTMAKGISDGISKYFSLY